MPAVPKQRGAARRNLHPRGSRVRSQGPLRRTSPWVQHMGQRNRHQSYTSRLPWLRRLACEGRVTPRGTGRPVCPELRAAAHRPLPRNRG
ncbi:hypothetical protein ACFPRL_26270 [Pseudoclavibacter helvolus]